VASGHVLEIISLDGHQPGFNHSVRMLQRPHSARVSEETECHRNVIFLGSH